MTHFRNLSIQSGITFINGKPYGFKATIEEFVVFGGELLINLSVKTENGLVWSSFNNQPEWANMPKWVGDIFAGQLVW